MYEEVINSKIKYFVVIYSMKTFDELIDLLLSKEMLEVKYAYQDNLMFNYNVLEKKVINNGIVMEFEEGIIGFKTYDFTYTIDPSDYDLAIFEEVYDYYMVEYIERVISFHNKIEKKYSETNILSDGRYEVDYEVAYLTGEGSLMFPDHYSNFEISLF